MPFFSTRYMKGVPFPYKMVKKRGTFKFVLRFICLKFVFWPLRHRLVRVCILYFQIPNMPSGTMLCCGENVRLPLSSSDSPRFFWGLFPQIGISCWVQIVSTAYFQVHLKTITEENKVRYGGFEDSHLRPILKQPHKWINHYMLEGC